MANGKNNKMKSELSQTDKQIVVIVLVFLVAIFACVAEFLWLYKPAVKELEGLEQTYKGLEVRVNEAKRVPSQIEYYREQIDILEGKTTDDETGETNELRQEIDVPTILAIVEESATTANMKLTSIAMDGNAAYIKGGVISGNKNNQGSQNGEQIPEVESSSFYRLGITMDVTSITYDGLMQFLASMEAADYYLTTSSAHLSTGNGVEYSGKISFYIYSFVSSSK